MEDIEQTCCNLTLEEFRNAKHYRTIFTLYPFTCHHVFYFLFTREETKECIYENDQRTKGK